MTLFLRLINDYFRHEMRVPLILGQVVHHYFNGSPIDHLRFKNTYGNVLHLMVEAVFAYCYTWLWGYGIGGSYALDIFIFGLVNGVVGIGLVLILKVYL